MKLQRNIRFIVLALVVLIVSATGVSAQNRRSLSLDQTITIGLEQSKSLHASLMRVDAANAKSSETNASRLPKVTFGGTYTRLSEIPSTVLPLSETRSFEFPAIFNNYNLKLTLQQPLFTGFKISSGAEMAEYNANATEQDYKKDQSELVLNIKTAYWNLFKAKEVKKVLEENVGQIQSHLKDVQNLFNQGIATNNEVLKVQVQLSNVQLMLLDMENNVQLAMVNLNYLMNQPLSTDLELTSSPTDNIQYSVTENLDALINKALNQRTEVKGMEYRLKAGESAVTFAKSGWYPQVYLVGNYNYSNPNQRYFPQKNQFDGTWDASIALSMDIWNWGQTINQTEQAQAQLEQAHDGLAQLRDGISMEVTSSFLSLKKSKESIELATKGVKQAEENYRITNEKFKAGLASNTDLLDAEVALLQAKTNHTTSLVDFELAQARLEKSLGEQQ